MAPPINAPILVVDDDRGLLLLVERTLKREGFAVVTAASGEEALQKLHEMPFLLAVLDLHLPDISGREIIRQISEAFPDLPFAVITGQGDERVAVELMRQGAIDYLVKDREFMEVMPARVKRAVEHLANLRRLAQAEEALKREHAFNKAILDTAGGLVYVLDRNGTIVRANRAVEQLTGYCVTELEGQSFFNKCVPGEEREEAARAFEEIVRGKSHSDYIHRLLCRSGETRWITWSDTHLRGDSGEIEFVIKTGIDITERRRLEKELLEVSGREQRRIGQDLHDGLGQHLTGIELLSDCLEQTLKKKRRPEAADAAKIARHVRQAIVQTKNLARGLSPVNPDTNGLMSALQELCRSVSEMGVPRCDFQSRAAVLIKNNEAASHLYRIAQESINNAVKHGRPTKVVVRLEDQGNGHKVLEILDNGTGLPQALGTEGMGLQIMKYRAGIIGALLEVKNLPQGGVRVRCTFKGDL